MLDDGLDFSFSGLKTAVVQYVRKHPDVEVADVAASFQAAIVDVLVDKLLGAADADGHRDGGRRRRGRRQLGAARATRSTVGDGDVRVVLPAIDLCTDNAAMVGAVAAYRLAADGPTPLDAPVVPNLAL